MVAEIARLHPAIMHGGARGVRIPIQATDQALVTANARGVLQATPTLEPIVSALRECGSASFCRKSGRSFLVTS